MIIDLNDQLTISNVHQCHLDWRAAADDPDDLIVDAGSLKTIDTAGLQLLLVLRRRVERDGRTFTIRNPPEELVSVAKLVGLCDELELPR